MFNTGIGYSDSEWDNLEMHNLFATQSEGRFFHYTSLASAKDMLKIENKQMVLFASHFLFLNDSQEFKEGLALLINKLNDMSNRKDLNSEIVQTCQKYKERFSKDPDLLETVYPNHFIISFCKEGNSLGQWKYYGKDSGIAIEYDLRNLNYDGNYTWKRKQLGTHPIYDVLYEKGKKEEAIQDILNSMNDIEDNFEYQSEIIIMCACAAVSFMKSRFFDKEEEARLLFAPIFNGHMEMSEKNYPMRLVHYRETGGKIKPYLKISVQHKDTASVPIKSITIGPGYNQMQIFNAIVMLVQSFYPCISTSTDDEMKLNEDTLYKDGCRFTDVNGIRIRVSSIPFRE